ncbi:MAG: hypothetical protein J6Y25_00620 [Elusimicrobiaceae bacterium]|nr:hypothetical protein [Elusimicrobiaceae bacterium]
MPNKIWIINLDEVVASENLLEAIADYSPKYIQLLKPQDYCILSRWAPVDKDFFAYMARIKKLKHTSWLFQPAEQEPDERLVDAVLRDEVLLGKLRKLCNMGYVMVPFMYTKRFEALSKKCGNNLNNNYKAIEQANNKLLFKNACKKFGITTIAPIYQAGKNKTPRILSPLDAKETYLLRRPFSAGGYGNVKGKLVDLLPLIKKYHKKTDLYLERYKDIYRTLGTLCILKDEGIYYAGVDCQIIHKEAWEGCFFPFTKCPAKILQEVREKSLMLASFYYGMGIRGQINFDWALRWKGGELKLRALECNPRYNGFGVCLRLASTVYGIPRNQLHFYLDTKIQFSPSWNTKRVIAELKKINEEMNIHGGVILTSAVKEGHAGFCFVGTSRKEIADIRRCFKRHVRGYIPRKKTTKKQK